MRNIRTRGRVVKNPIAYVCIFISICCILITIMSVLKLPDDSIDVSTPYFRSRNTMRYLGDKNIGYFGSMIIEMLPQDLAFTIFLPSERAFHRDLGLNKSENLNSEEFHNTYAILTRILGFSVVPRMILSVSVPSDGEIVYDSISGYNLCILKDADGRIVVNKIRSEKIDIRKGEIVVHIMDGVMMDPDFEQSVKPDEED